MNIHGIPNYFVMVLLPYLHEKAFVHKNKNIQLIFSCAKNDFATKQPPTHTSNFSNDSYFMTHIGDELRGFTGVYACILCVFVCV